jgi:uncharacterized repeat protein (TIGR01451 family)
MSHSPRKFSVRSAIAILAPILLLTTGAITAQGQTPPILDGNINDLISYAEFLDASGQGCGLNILDPAGDIVVADPMVIPCDPAFVQGVSTYFINGFDHTLGLVALSGNTLYLGIRVVGVIGDPDGNGDPDANCPLSTVQDAPGIEEAATYEWRFDTDCDDIFESIITVRDNTVFMTGITGNASFDFNGSDIEVHVANVSLAPLFQARTFSGHREDGLGEDISDQAACPPPEILVTLVKTVNPASLCPGQSTTVTLEVCNPNAFSLSGMAINDVLPAGFVYVPGSVTGIGAPTGTGTLVFPSFDLTPFQCRTITFQVTAPQECFGEVPNIASVTSTLTNACLPPPGFITSVASDTAFIDCLPMSNCDITGPMEICPGSTTTFTVTGLEPGMFHWIVSGDATISGANNMVNVSVLAGASGSFSLSVVLNVTTPCATGCTISRTISETCVVNCPRTAGFWTQQCEQKKGGSTKFTVDQMNLITACVDQQVNIFSWGNDFDSFCSIVNPDRPMTQRKQALRQFAVLVANVCADQQNQVMANGGEIVLDLNTPVHFTGFTATTIGELIAEIDARLGLLAGGSASDHGYGAIISVADGINNGYGIGRTCNEDDDTDDDDSAASNLLSVGYDAVAPNQASPNPFRTATRIEYIVNGDAAQDVSVDVYNISGRLVRRLESGSKGPGRYESEWNGRSDAGESVAGGVYFIRIVTGSTQATSRVLYVK